METLPQDIFHLSLLVFVLGLKHGFDADHLATIDGLTRYNVVANPRLARFCGVLFSVGHGAVVIAIALAVSTLTQHWETPEWLELVGTWISVGFLVMLGVLNLHAVMRTDPTQVVRSIGLKSRFAGGLSRASHPILVALVGAMFALSFDTVSQAALFALAAPQSGGWQYVLMLGTLFMLGMLVMDGLNGFWISRLFNRADRMALLASRVMSLVVAGLSFLVAAFGVMKLSFPTVGVWSEGKELFFSAGLIGVIIASFVSAVMLTRKGNVISKANSFSS